MAWIMPKTKPWRANSILGDASANSHEGCHDGYVIAWKRGPKGQG
jgi:hypothetical protein